MSKHECMPHTDSKKNVLRTILKRLYQNLFLYMIKYCFPNLVCVLAGQYIMSLIK